MTDHRLLFDQDDCPWGPRTPPVAQPFSSINAEQHFCLPDENGERYFKKIPCRHYNSGPKNAIIITTYNKKYTVGNSFFFDDDFMVYLCTE